MAKDPDQIVPPSKELRIVRGRVAEADRMVKAMAKGEWAGGARLVKGGERSSVWRGSAMGRELVVKCQRVAKGRRALGRLAGRTRLARQWHGAAQLILAGIPTAEPLVYWRGKDEEGNRVEALALTYIETATLLHTVAQGGVDVRAEHGLARAAGELTAALAGAGLLNRDHKASNILAMRDEAAAGSGVGGWKLILVDTVGVEAVKGREPERMLANLYYEFGGTGTVVRRVLLWRCVRSYCVARGVEDVKGVWRRVARVVERHGDMTPRDDPLGEGTRE